jgi:hypothetical protein
MSEKRDPPDDGLQPPEIDGGGLAVDALRSALKGLGGAAPSASSPVEPRPPAPVAQSAPSQPPAMFDLADSPHPLSLQTLDSASEDKTESYEPPVNPRGLASAARPAAPQDVIIGRDATGETDPAHDRRFHAPDFDHRSMKLELETVAPPRPAQPPPAAAPEAPPPESPADETASPEADIGELKPIPGRIMQGALRKNPPVRIAIGLVLGLAFGYFLAAPYANRAERHVAELRASADVDRYKNDPEARARAAELDQKADQASTTAVYGMVAIWLLAGAGVVAGWFRLT